MTAASLGRALETRGYCHLDATTVAAAIGPRAVEGWPDFARSWNDLELDGFMADGGIYRRRRYACYAVRGSVVERLPHQPHYQTTRANPLNGGIERWFAPVDDAIGRHPALRRLLKMCARTFAADAGAAAHHAWLVETHQFRIEATATAAGLPTPEGVHRDGVDWVFVCLVGSSNVEGGVTSIHGADGRPLEEFRLQTPLEAVVLDDHRVRHGVTPVRVRDASAAAWRDVLVLTYRAVLVAGTPRAPSFTCPRDVTANQLGRTSGSPASADVRSRTACSA